MAKLQAPISATPNPTALADATARFISVFFESRYGTVRLAPPTPAIALKPPINAPITGVGQLAIAADSAPRSPDARGRLIIILTAK